ncbi:MAG: hypothetical protein HYZ14_12270 [Bacteroidetes bacterium]|nr:hypothetical protein [Bacteroidota bacterium]
MEKQQFTNMESPFVWYALYYQSAKAQNEEEHKKAKLFLTKTLVSEFTLEEMHSYFNGQLLFAIDTLKMMETYYEIVDTLTDAVTDYDPNLAISVNMVWRQKKLTAPSVYFIHAQGYSDSDEQFQTLIADFWPDAEIATRSAIRVKYKQN